MIKEHEGAEYVDIHYLTERLMEELEGVTPDQFIARRDEDPSIAPVNIEGVQYWPKIQVDMRLKKLTKDDPDAGASHP